MQIDRISITNFLSARASDFSLDRVNLFAGPNGSGKSSIRDAIAFALTGKPARDVKLKRDYVRLLSNGTKKGAVEIAFANELTVARAVHTGAGDDRIVEGIDELDAFRFVTDMHHFMSISEDERRSALFKIMRVELNAKWVGEKLLGLGCAASNINRILPSLHGRNGFANAEQAARDGAKDARAAWRAITGEVYGADKAEDWRPEYDPKLNEATKERVNAALENLNASRDRVESVTTELSGLTAKANQSAGVQERITELEPIARLYAAREDAYREASARCGESKDILDEAQRALSAAKANLTAARSGMQQQKKFNHWPCPECGTQLRYAKDINELVAFVEQEQPKKIDDAPLVAIVEQTTQSADAAHKEYRGWRENMDKAEAALKESDAAATRLDALREIEAQDESELAGKIAELREALSQSTKALSQRQEAHDYWSNLLRAKSDFEQRVDSAKKAHEDVKEYLVLADALAPSGLQAQVLSSAIGPFNDTLSEFCAAAGFKPIRIKESMLLSVGDNDYPLCSESEQWRADAILSAAIARHSGVGFFVLDRLDVLDLRGDRGGVLKWLMSIGDELQSIVMGTLKSIPKDRPGYKGFWLGGGRV